MYLYFCWTKVFTVLHTEPCRLYIGLFLYESMSSAGYRSSPSSPLLCWEPLLNIRISSRSNSVLCTVPIKIKINRNLPNICRVGVMFLLGAFCLSWTWIWRILNLSCVTRWLSAVHLSFGIFYKQAIRKCYPIFLKQNTLSNIFEIFMD